MTKEQKSGILVYVQASKPTGERDSPHLFLNTARKRCGVPQITKGPDRLSAESPYPKGICVILYRKHVRAIFVGKISLGGLVPDSCTMALTFTNSVLWTFIFILAICLVAQEMNES